MHTQVTVAPNGRISLPAAVRKRLGVAHGGQLLLEEAEGSVILRTVPRSVAEAQAIARRHTGGKPEASVDAFLARRRADSGE